MHKRPPLPICSLCVWKWVSTVNNLTQNVARCFSEGHIFATRGFKLYSLINRKPPYGICGSGYCHPSVHSVVISMAISNVVRL